MSKGSRRAKISVTGVIVTAVVTAGFVWAAVQWYNRDNWPPRFSPGDIRTNEIKTFENLQLIALAQERYKKGDWHADGKKTYAGFLVHLWKRTDKEKGPILVDLIPRKLAFAMGSSEAVAGYYFVDVHDLALPLRGQTRRLDYESQWAVAAVPAAHAETGFLIFLADRSGRTLVKNQRGIPSTYPHDSLAAGWTQIGSVDELRAFQKAMDIYH
ncbi:MAG: hypothetical protein ACYTBJ_08490 [Planctomycetota bacterium]|jgi:hypothetical protein